MNNLPSRSETPQECLHRLDWNINDAKEAMQNAIGMKDWDGVIKYANQIKALERLRFDAMKPSKG